MMQLFLGHGIDVFGGGRLKSCIQIHISNDYLHILSYHEHFEIVLYTLDSWTL